MELIRGTNPRVAPPVPKNPFADIRISSLYRDIIAALSIYNVSPPAFNSERPGYVDMAQIDQTQPTQTTHI